MAIKLTKPVMQKVCDELALGKSLRSVCKNNKDLPHWVTVLKRVQRDDNLYEMYDKARAIGAEILADHMFDLARQPLDISDPKFANAEVQRRRLEIETLKWVFAKQQPKGIRNKADDVAQSNVVVFSWDNGADDVSARQIDEKPIVVEAVGIDGSDEDVLH